MLNVLYNSCMGPDALHGRMQLHGAASSVFTAHRHVWGTPPAPSLPALGTHCVCMSVECFPVRSNLTCPRRAWVYQGGSSMFPSCFTGDCGKQIGALLDSDKASNGATDGDAMPYVTFDLGFERTDVRSVTLAGRADGDLVQSQMVSVYISTSKPFNASGSTLVRANITFSTLGEKLEILCPPGTPARYVTVVRSNTNMVGRL